MTDASYNSYEFLPSEYDAAARRFISAGVEAIMEAQGGVYSLVSKESMSQLPDYSSPLQDDEILRGRPMEAVSGMAIDYDDVISGDLDSILVAMYKIGMEMEGQISKGILTHISDICNRTGNVVNGEISYDSIADAVECIDFSFDENGNHNLSIVASPEMAQKLQALGDPTPEQQARLDEIISRRRGEWDARRSSRRLPSRRL